MEGVVGCMSNDRLLFLRVDFFDLDVVFFLTLMNFNFYSNVTDFE